MLLIDLSSKTSIQSAAQFLIENLDKLDVLIHNAAAFDISQKVPQYSFDGIESIWAIAQLMYTFHLVETL